MFVNPLFNPKSLNIEFFPVGKRLQIGAEFVAFSRTFGFAPYSPVPDLQHA